MSVPVATSASNVANRASEVPAGTATVYFAVWSLAAGLVVGKLAPLGFFRVAGRLVAGTRPATEVCSVPVNPDFNATVAVPDAPVPFTPVGRTASWLCTLWVPSVQVRPPVT